METLCSTCLSRNRCVTSIKNIVNGDNLDYLDMSIQKFVCWECKAMFNKLSKFKKQVVTAQHVLRNKIISKFNLSHLQIENQRNVISIKERNFEKESLHTYVAILEDPFDIKEENDSMNNFENVDYDNLIPHEHKEVDNIIENNDYDNLIPVIDCKEVNKHKEKYTNHIENRDNDNLMPVIECEEVNKHKEVKDTKCKQIDIVTNLKGNILRKVTMGQTLKIISDLFDEAGQSKEVELFLTTHEQRMERFNIRLLTDVEMLNLREERKSRSLYVASKFKCDMCILQYYAEYKYKQHCSNYHVKKKGYIPCNICKCYISDKETHRDHFARHYVIYQCKECGYEEQNQKAFTRHYRVVHEMAGYMCQHCEQEFITESKMRQHIERHHTVIPPCEMCDKTFCTKIGRTKHMRSHKGVTKIKCDTCGKEYKGLENLRAHQRIHNPALANENAYCAECDKQFKNMYQYNRHIKVNEKHRPPGELRHKCPECFKQFIIESALKMHMQAVHQTKRDFICSICDKGFIRRNRLEEHIMHKHEGVPRPRKYPCTYCDKVFTWRAILINHIRTHTGEKPFECNVCRRKFNQRASLRTHIVGVHKMSRADAARNIRTGDEHV